MGYYNYSFFKTNPNALLFFILSSECDSWFGLHPALWEAGGLVLMFIVGSMYVCAHKAIDTDMGLHERTRHRTRRTMNECIHRVSTEDMSDKRILLSWYIGSTSGHGRYTNL